MPKILKPSTKNNQELSRGNESSVNMDSTDSSVERSNVFSTPLFEKNACIIRVEAASSNQTSLRANSKGDPSVKPSEFALREPILILSTASNQPKNTEIPDPKGNVSDIRDNPQIKHKPKVLIETSVVKHPTIFDKSSIKKRKMDGSSLLDEEFEGNQMDLEHEECQELELQSKTCLEVVSETLSSLTLFLTNKNNGEPGNLRDTCLKAFDKLTKKMSIMEREISNLKHQLSGKLNTSSVQPARDSPFSTGSTSFAQIVEEQKAEEIGRSGSAQSSKKVFKPVSRSASKPVGFDSSKKDIQPLVNQKVKTATKTPPKDVSQSVTKPAAKPKPIPSFKPRFDCKDYSRTLIIKGDNAMKKIKEGIKPSSLNVSIDLCRENPNKEVVLKMSSSADADKMSLQIKSMFSDFAIRKPSQLAPRFEVLGLSLDTKEEEIVNTVLTNNKEILGDSGLKLVRVQKNPRNMTAIFEASGAAFKRVIENGKIMTEWQRLKVRESLNVDRCFKCLEFGHLKKDCKATLTCHRCASQEHVAKDCEVEVKKCVVCVKHNSQFKTQLSTEHSCLDAQCPLLARRLAIKKAKVNYDAMMPTSHEGDMDTSG
jgi:hypothetical protein